MCYVTDRLALPATGGGSAADSVVEVIRRNLAAGTDWIQIREKDLPTPGLLELVRAALDAPRKQGQLILVNDRLDMALAAGTSGVHLGHESLPVGEVVRWCRAGHAPADFLIGASCHSLDDAVEAERAAADYVFFGPVFFTPSKASYGQPQGLERLAAVCRHVHIPVLAIGGVTIENAQACLAAGAAGIAAIRLFQDAADLPGVVTQLRAL